MFNLPTEVYIIHISLNNDKVQSFFFAIVLILLNVCIWRLLINWFFVCECLLLSWPYLFTEKYSVFSPKNSFNSFKKVHLEIINISTTVQLGQSDNQFIV